MQKVALIGAGNLGSHLFDAWHKHPAISITQWLNRSESKTALGDTQIISDITDLRSNSIYVLCLPDSEIETVSAQLPRTGMAIHTSGSIPLSALQNKGPKAVLYPLQSFSKEKAVTFESIPFFLEVEKQASKKKVQTLVHTLSLNYYWMDSQQRLRLHMAAVFVNNFSNHLYQIGADICRKNDIPFEVLLPLIQETTSKLHTLSPEQAQTGPARRQDQNVIEKHLEQLQDPKKKEIYTLLTQAIHKQYHD